MTTTTTTPGGGEPRPARIGFVLEQALGHRTHAANLQRVVDGAGGAHGAGIDATWLPVDFDVCGPAATLPLYATNWTVRAGLRARQAVARAHRRASLDALFVHTQVPAVLLGGWMDRIPTVVSLDATPRQYDSLGASYSHQQGGRHSEALKWRLNRRCFQRAAALVTWSAWAKQGLIDDYGVDPDDVTVVPPGVRIAGWERPPRRRRDGTDVRILFVGGDLHRKGGHLLLDAVRALRAERPADARRGAPGARGVVVDLVTQADVAPADGLNVHRGLRPNSAELRRLYHDADIFCLPSLGDCLPMVLAEAGAAGLPLVASAVGAIGEVVRDDHTGILVPAGDVGALTRALRHLVDDEGSRRRLGQGAQQLVQRDHDVDRNAGRLLSILRSVAACDLDRTPMPAAAAITAHGGGRP